MGRHSAPDDSDEDVDPTGDAGGTDVALATGTAAGTDTDAAPEGRHTRDRGPRPRPSATDEPSATDDLAATDEPPTEGLGLLDDAFAEQSDAVPPMVVVDAETAQAMVLEPIDEPLVPEPAVAEPAVTELVAAAAPVAAPAAGPSPSPIPTDPATPAEAPSTGRPARGAGARATRHDFALVMHHRDVRARAAAAVLVPFVVYVAVFAVIGKLQVHSLIWIWIPAIVAGVLVGLVLDAGHRRYPALGAGNDAPAPVSEPAGPA